MNEESDAPESCQASAVNSCDALKHDNSDTAANSAVNWSGRELDRDIDVWLHAVPGLNFFAVVDRLID
jgi:hypothetical protein